MTADLEARFVTLAARERAAIRRGEFEALAALLDARTALLSELERDVPDAETLRRIAALGAQTDRLLAAARRGLDSARLRLAEIARGAPLETYSAQGERHGLGAARPTLTRRA